MSSKPKRTSPNAEAKRTQTKSALRSIKTPENFQTPVLIKKQDKIPVIGFIGLPSAGKSSAVNSLIGKHILNTGVCRTTTNVHHVGPDNIFDLPKDQFHRHTPVSDDGVYYTILDLPGLADSENKGKEENFDKMSQQYVVKCDIVCWVTDIKTAFLTTHEKAEFDLIKNLLDETAKTTGRLYQIFILLSKYDDDDSDNNHSPSSKSKVVINTNASPKSDSLPDNLIYFDEIESDEELSADNEDTTVKDCLKRVESLFEETKIKIVKFNAFGRILHSESASDKLKSITKKTMPYASKCNNHFYAKWMIEDFDEKQQNAYLNTLINYHFFRAGGRLFVCEYGININDTTTPCPRKNLCNFHKSTCIHGYLKISDSCPQPNCNHHGSRSCCDFGRMKIGGNCENEYCPDHGDHSKNQYQYDSGKIYEILKHITNENVVDKMLDFMIIDRKISEESSNNIKTSKKFGLIKKKRIEELEEHLEDFVEETWKIYQDHGYYEEYEKLNEYSDEDDENLDEEEDNIGIQISECTKPVIVINRHFFTECLDDVNNTMTTEYTIESLIKLFEEIGEINNVDNFSELYNLLKEYFYTDYIIRKKARNLELTKNAKKHGIILDTELERAFANIIPFDDFDIMISQDEIPESKLVKKCNEIYSFVNDFRDESDKVEENENYIVFRYSESWKLRAFDTDTKVKEFLREYFSTNITILQKYDPVKWNTFMNIIKVQKHLEKVDTINGVLIKDLKSPHQLFRLMKILGTSNKSVQQLYLNLIKTQTNIGISNQNITLNEPRKSNVLVEYGGPSFFNMDHEFTSNRNIMINKEWINNLIKIRIDLWGEDEERKVDIYGLLMNVWHGTVWSIFAPIDKILPQ